MTSSIIPEPSASSLGTVLDFMRLIWAVDHALQTASKRMEAACGVTGPQRLVIRIIGRFPGMSAGLLAHTLHLHPSTVTGILKRLEAKDFLSRRPDPLDGRRALFGLTPSGHRLESEQIGTVEGAVRDVLQAVPEASVRAVREVLESLASRLNDAKAETPKRER